ncbi:hypothetical protein GCM10009760_20270 [Kitasatospora kazusensis]|uniref:DUF5709 domain-containing protein n=1 Tax=Kitasatospora kazusensis TaxID=407974 RepID=A0ABP5L0F4_9ACTN
MRQNPENPEFPEDYDDFAEESPATAETADEERELGDRPADGYEQLRERRSLGSAAAVNEADAAEQIRVVDLDEDEYR